MNKYIFKFVHTKAPRDFLGTLGDGFTKQGTLTLERNSIIVPMGGENYVGDLQGAHYKYRHNISFPQ